MFKSSREGVSNLWVLEEKSDWWRRSNREPIQLTSGPMNYYQPPAATARVSLPSGPSPLASWFATMPAGKILCYF